MIILGLDCATQTGWCIYDSDKSKILESGSKSFKKKKKELNGKLFLNFELWLNKMLGFLPAISMVTSSGETFLYPRTYNMFRVQATDIRSASFLLIEPLTMGRSVRPLALSAATSK